MSLFPLETATGQSGSLPLLPVYVAAWGHYGEEKNDACGGRQWPERTVMLSSWLDLAGGRTRGFKREEKKKKREVEGGGRRGRGRCLFQENTLYDRDLTVIVSLQSTAENLKGAERLPAEARPVPDSEREAFNRAGANRDQDCSAHCLRACQDERQQQWNGFAYICGIWTACWFNCSDDYGDIRIMMMISNSSNNNNSGHWKV